MWYTGAYEQPLETTLTQDYYFADRSNLTGKICSSGENCNDGIIRTTTWIGKIALINGSDYGYAVGNGDDNIRNSCLNTPIRVWTEKCYLFK